jgi:energy-coupling factor transport system ATP-binding protein
MASLAGLAPLPVTVKEARALVRDVHVATPEQHEPPAPRRVPAALALHRVWVELHDGRDTVTVLRDLSLELHAGETVALLGRNGAGKSTLLRAAAGLVAPARGSVRAAGEVALLLQTPSDYLLHEAVEKELPPAAAVAALRELGLEHLGAADPRDLSGGERQRLALGVVLAGRGIGIGAPPAVVALDEPTRGVDPQRKRELAQRIGDLAAQGAAVIVATHDVEFAARAAARCVLLGSGRVVADGTTTEVLAGGRYFTTEVARTLGAEAGVIVPEQGAHALRAGLEGRERARRRRAVASP